MAAATSAVIGVGGMISFDADIPSMETDKRVDWIGATLITIGLVLIVFVLGQGEIAPQGWKTPCKATSLSHHASSLNICAIITRYHCASYPGGYHGRAIPVLGAILGTSSR